MPAPKGQTEGKGIASDASDYENLAEAAPVAAAPGIAEDAKSFEGLVDETTDKARTLDSDWLYQKGGAVFGPVKPKDLLELLYSGEIDKDTPIALDGGDFEALHRYGVFRVHLPKALKHQEEMAARRAEEAALTKARLVRRMKWAGLAVAIGAVVTIGLVALVRHRKELESQAQARAKEAALLKEIDDLMGRITLEPPLVALVNENENKEEATDAKKKRPRAVARFSGSAGGSSSTEELSKSEIMSGIATAFPGFKRCIVEQIQRDPDSVPEQIVLSFSINNDGIVQGFSLADRGLRGTTFSECMTAKLSQVRFRKYKGEVQNVEYPITIGRH